MHDALLRALLSSNGKYSMRSNNAQLLVANFLWQDISIISSNINLNPTESIKTC